MLVRQTKDTFIRKYGDFGYITNQLTKHDRVYNESGADFLETITRMPRDTDDILKELFNLFKDASIDELKKDFLEFILDLENDWFLVTGSSVEELNLKEPTFSYKSANPKTATNSFGNLDKKDLVNDSVSFIYDNFKENPQILGLQVEISSRCNERCIHCYIPNSKKTYGVDIDLSFCLRVLDEAKELGTLQLTLSGGELFMHKDIAVILRYARENDFSISILSNLVLLTDELIQILKEINPSIVQVSLYSMNPKEHDAITQVKGSFEKTKKSIEELVEAQIPVQISCPVMKINRKSYKDVLIYANKLRSKAYTDFIMMAQTDHNINNLLHRINLQETEELLMDIIKFDQDYIETTLHQESKSKNIERYKNLPVCGVGFDSICLSSDGNYFPCPGWQGLIVGNGYNQSLKEVWKNSGQLKQLRTITNKSYPVCLSCDALDYCAMCMVRNYNENNGDIFKITKHFCDVAFLNKKLVDKHIYNK
ncbi:radical SAM protein [Bacteroidota bacterium]